MKRNFVCFSLVLLIFGTALPTLCSEDPLEAKVIEIQKALHDGTLPSIIERYEALVAERTADASLHYLLGVAYMYAEDGPPFDNAYTEFTKARSLDPKMKYVNTSIAYILWKRGQYDNAIESYKAEIALDPGYGWNYYSLGTAYGELKQWDKAKSQYILAIDKVKNDPRIAKAHNNLGLIYMDWDGDYFKALENFTKAVELKPYVPFYRENYNRAIRKLIQLRESLDKGQTNLPPETVERLKKMDLTEIEVDAGA